MKLGALTGSGETAPVTGFAIDHRKVAPGTVFGAFPGARFNGEDFIADAVSSGAVAVVSRPETQVAGAVHIAAAEPRRAFARLAAKFFRPFPDVIVAVTGTNGKTSNVELVRQLWRMAGHPSASIGTLGVTTSDEQVTTGLTTPDIVTFLSNMAGLERMGITHAAFEASSHGLAQYRTEGVPVAAAAFTNFTRDHLDYHGTMQAYFEAKMRLFEDVLEPGASAVVWTDDPRSDEVIARARARGLQVLTVGSRGETLKLLKRETTQLGQKLIVAAGGRTHVITLALIGAYQAANALTAAGLAIATGGETGQTLANLARVHPVRGRLERAVITRAGAPVYVDYAHTPDAIEAACEALRPHAQARLIIVFGAGGDRDRGKRAGMGAVAARCADLMIVTDDNPRGEDPAAIRREILAGAPAAREIASRRDAIRVAIAEAGPGDVVLLAGKGHEQGQIVGDRVLPFDDVAVAREEAA
ncbi:MAG: UDP-N-acetylmuramoyl-L-alanyl-D-glutamate--2,6-diaminopimelate ligase [Sphingomonadales bacterium]|jgi:UDP-N-acetylmuramoyl-L-alanyl-D-glutamate--2,6-diaminopimelate ligase|nr:UDP-N-acetylmuramoyl-L-alanyl-D-glutamate--2,6-diaminopimelate ligase [Sphingomonadales bacterium]